MSLYLLFIFLSLAFVPCIDAQGSSDISLPPPGEVSMVLEESMFRRKSVRNFTTDPVSDEDLSLVLWAAYGMQQDGDQTVPEILGNHAAVLYVLLEDAAYIYDPLNHSLVQFKEGDWRDTVGHQYSAPVQLALCFDLDIADPCFAGEEIGMMAQNIAFMANALGLGTLVTAQIPPATDPLGLPDNQEGLSVMPLGHPDYDAYQFTYRPLWFSLLPRIQQSIMTVSTALEQRSEADTFTGTLSRQEHSQMMWATCGYSYYRDKSNDPIYSKGRHRTIPSGKGYYPVDFYAVTEKGIYRYIPNLIQTHVVPVDFYGLPILTFALRVVKGDYRNEVAQACDLSSIAESSFILLSVLDREKTRPLGQPDLSDDIFLLTWYHDAGAAAQNVLLEATAWDIHANLYHITDQSAICTLLDLDDTTNIPIYTIPMGK